MAEIRINTTGGLKLYDADDSHYAQIIAGTITSNTDVMTLGHNVIDIPMTTASSSATTGALTIGGGLGVAADLYVGDDPYLITDSAVLGFGADKDTTLTHTDGTGLTLNSTNKLCFNDASQFVQGISATVLGLGATDEIDLTATAIDINGTCDISGTFSLGGTNITTTAAEINLIDGGTSRGTTALADGDGILINDDGTMRMTTVQTVKTYMATAALAGIDDQSSSNDDQITIADGEVCINEDSDDVDFRVETNSKQHCLFVNGGTDAVGVNEDTPEGDITIQQAADDDQIFSLKSSDVAHGITGMVETDSYFTLQKYSATEGGLQARGYTEADIGCQFQVVHTTVNTTASSSGRAGFEISTAKKTGTGKTTTDGQLFAIRNNNSTRLILQEGGQLYVDASYDNTFDTFEDAQLARAYDLSHGRGVIDSKFDKFISYNHEKLAELDLVGREEDGTPNHFVNVTGMQRLHNGAIWQQYEKHNQLLEAVYDLAKEAVGEDKANAILDKHEVKRLQ